MNTGFNTHGLGEVGVCMRGLAFILAGVGGGLKKHWGVVVGAYCVFCMRGVLGVVSGVCRVVCVWVFCVGGHMTGQAHARGQGMRAHGCW